MIGEKGVGSIISYNVKLSIWGSWPQNVQVIRTCGNKAKKLFFGLDHNLNVTVHLKFDYFDAAWIISWCLEARMTMWMTAMVLRGKFTDEGGDPGVVSLYPPAIDTHGWWYKRGGYDKDDNGNDNDDVVRSAMMMEPPSCIFVTLMTLLIASKMLRVSSKKKKN